MHFLDRRLGTRDGQGRGVQLATGFDLSTLESQHLHGRHRTLSHQRLGHVDFLALQAQGLAVLRLLGGELAQFLLALDQLFLQPANFVMQLLATADVQGLFAGRLHWHGFHHVIRERQRAVVDFRAQTLHAQQHGQAVGFGFADVGHKSRVVQANQRRAGLDDLPFAHEEFGDDAPFKILYFLQLGRWDRLAVAFGDLIDHRKIGPQQQEQEKTDNGPDGQSHHPWGVFDQRFVDLGQGLAVQRIGTLEVTTDRVFHPGLKQH
ncbi:hypothetical protein D3C78_795650 [compost metagenome]